MKFLILLYIAFKNRVGMSPTVDLFFTKTI